MQLTYLGHAGWLCEVGSLRLLFDPILGASHAGGLFSVEPRRRLSAESLRADFIFVSHVHFDHFDVASLGQLAQADDESVVVTSDPLIAETALALGFRHAKVIPPGARLELADGVSVITTPSAAPEVEWGLIVCDASGCVWNLIDTVFGSHEDVERIRKVALGERQLDLAIAPLQPMREIAMATAGFIGFEARAYQQLLACARAAGAKAVTPSACGERFVAPFEAMNAVVYPISRERAVRDFARFAPEARLAVPELGEQLTLQAGALTLSPGALPIDRHEPSAPASATLRCFRPWSPVPLSDPNLEQQPYEALVCTIEPWLRNQLAPALKRELGEHAEFNDKSFVLEIVYEQKVEHFSLRADGELRAEFDPEYDSLVAIAASMLADVIEGRRAWVEPLLAGLLRCVERGTVVARGELQELPIAPIFLYYALSVRESVERAVRYRTRQWLAAR